MMQEMMVGAIFALSAFTFSFAGFGFALVAVPLLALILPVKAAVAIQFPLMYGVVLYHAWRFGRKVRWRQMAPLFIGAGLGLPLGVWSLNSFPETAMKRILAVFIVLVIFNNYFKSGRRRLKFFVTSKCLGGFMGVISGWFTGAFCTGGPPGVLYVSALGVEPETAKGLLGNYFVFVCTYLGILLSVNGMLTSSIWMDSLKYSPAVAAGIFLGAVMTRCVSTRGYRLTVDILLVLTSVMLWMRG
jgi:hypothetical protein